MKKPASVDDYLDGLTNWSDELHRLVEILRGCGMEEAIKWGVPVYSYHGSNIVGVSGFKSYFGLWFYHGSLLDDPHSVLLNAQEGKTRGMRQWRMNSTKEIRVTWIKALIKQSKVVVDQGQQVKPRRNRTLEIPQLLATAFSSDKQLKDAFEQLSLSCRREYAEYISEAKREATQQRRLEKILPMIKNNAGLNDKYR